MTAFQYAIPHHEPKSDDYVEPFLCLQIFCFKRKEDLPAMYFNLAYTTEAEESPADYLQSLTINHVQAYSVIFRRRPEGFMLCLN